MLTASLLKTDSKPTSLSSHRAQMRQAHEQLSQRTAAWAASARRPEDSMAISLDGKVIGSVDVLPTTSLAGLRALLGERFPKLPGLPDAYLFLAADGNPIPQDQEDNMPSLAFLPEVKITPEEMKRKRRNREPEAEEKKEPEKPAARSGASAGQSVRDHRDRDARRAGSPPRGPRASEVLRGSPP
ncbi:unnamed protein product, partial [Prorocentrum cordatum]